MKKYGTKILLVFAVIIALVLGMQFCNHQAQARGGFLNNKPLPDSMCAKCPWDGNQGRILYLHFDREEKQWIWTMSCYQQHIWECYANPQK